MIRNATMKDAESILNLVNENASKGLMLGKSPYAVYKDIQAYVVYEEEGKILGCARLNIAWNDLAEIASLAVDLNARGKGIGKRRSANLRIQGRPLPSNSSYVWRRTQRNHHSRQRGSKSWRQNWFVHQAI